MKPLEDLCDFGEALEIDKELEHWTVQWISPTFFFFLSVFLHAHLLTSGDTITMYG